MKIRNIMTPNAESCSAQADLAAAAMVMWRQDCGIVPIVDAERQLVGVITDRDICMAVATRHRRPEEISVNDVMSRKVSTVRPEEEVAVALEKMRAERVRRLPVVDGDGRLAGMLSLNDVILHTDPAARRGADLHAVDVLQTLRAICGHPVPMRTEPVKPAREREQLAHSH